MDSLLYLSDGQSSRRLPRRRRTQYKHLEPGKIVGNRWLRLIQAVEQAASQKVEVPSVSPVDFSVNKQAVARNTQLLDKHEYDRKNCCRCTPRPSRAGSRCCFCVGTPLHVPKGPNHLLRPKGFQLCFGHGFELRMVHYLSSLERARRRVGAFPAILSVTSLKRALSIHFHASSP